MAYSIIWSAFAESQLDEIFEFYSNEAGPLIARQLLKGIINESKVLLKTPYVGQEEELLTGRSIHYRYLLYNNYKLIYSVDEEERLIKIADVFHTRQYPQKIQRTK